MSNTQRAARALYLLAHCYTSAWRTNKKGQFNNGFNIHGKPIYYDNILQAHEYLKNNDVWVKCGDFVDVINLAQPGDLVYADPPYLQEKHEDGFNRYTPDRFGVDRHEQLANFLDSLAERNIMMMVSNEDCPTVREVYDQAQSAKFVPLGRIHSILKKRHEVVICNFDPPNISGN